VILRQYFSPHPDGYCFSAQLARQQCSSLAVVEPYDSAVSTILESGTAEVSIQADFNLAAD
jgi:hypothetical protein